MLNNFKYRVLPGDTENSICVKFNTSKQNILRNNPQIPLYAGEWIEIEVNNFLSHIVKPMQTLDEISKLYGISVENIKEFNKLQTDKLYIGQLIKIAKST